MPQREQNLQNHGRYVFLFHVVTFGILAMNLIGAVRMAIPPTKPSIWNLAMAIALVLLAWFTRAFPLTVQDRVIRLEERLRLAELAPELVAQGRRITPAQWTALRFASDDEFVALTRQVLDGKLTAPGDIKKAIQHWRADHLRA